MPIMETDELLAKIREIKADFRAEFQDTCGPFSSSLTRKAKMDWQPSD
jgi:hypothetical protein